MLGRDQVKKALAMALQLQAGRYEAVKLRARKMRRVLRPRQLTTENIESSVTTETNATLNKDPSSTTNAITSTDIDDSIIKTAINHNVTAIIANATATAVVDSSNKDVLMEEIWESVSDDSLEETHHTDEELVLSQWALDTALGVVMKVASPRMGRPNVRSKEEIADLAIDKHEKVILLF